MNIVEEIRKFVKEECLKPSSKYGFEPFEYHFEPTVKWADKLVDKLGGDREVILIATWLHDIGSIRHHFQVPSLLQKYNFG